MILYLGTEVVVFITNIYIYAHNIFFSIHININNLNDQGSGYVYYMCIDTLLFFMSHFVAFAVRSENIYAYFEFPEYVFFSLP